MAESQVQTLTLVFSVIIGIITLSGVAVTAVLQKRCGKVNSEEQMEHFFVLVLKAHFLLGSANAIAQKAHDLKRVFLTGFFVGCLAVTIHIGVYCLATGRQAEIEEVG